MLNYLILVSGRVQGVGFRYTTWQLALEMGLVGTVENLANGRVKIVVQGPGATVKQFLLKIADGPSPYSRVDHVQTTPQPLADFTDFKIKN